MGHPSSLITAPCYAVSPGTGRLECRYPYGNAPNPGLPILFQDNFESGNLNHTQNGISWAGGSNTAVSTQNQNGGTYSLKFSFTPAGSTAEQRFNLGQPYSEIAIAFDLYVPNGNESYGGMAYTHGTGNPANNKYFRLWRGPQSDGNNGYDQAYFKYGASLERGSTAGGMSQSNLSGEYGWNSTVGAYGSNGDVPGAILCGSTTNFIVLADRGLWLSAYIYCKCATIANNDGVLLIKKNGITVVNSTNLPSFPDTGGANNGFDFGYLLGFANAGFVANMYMFIDNVIISGRV